MIIERFQCTSAADAPAGSVYVGPGSKWAMPYYPELRDGKWIVTNGLISMEWGSEWEARLSALRLFAVYLDGGGHDTIQVDGGPMVALAAKDELRGKDLACTCKSDELHCHGDFLMLLANHEELD